MSELSRFYSIVIRMFVEFGGPHHVPHFHAYYQDDVGISIGKTAAKGVVVIYI